MENPNGSRFVLRSSFGFSAIPPPRDDKAHSLPLPKRVPDSGQNKEGKYEKSRTLLRQHRLHARLFRDFQYFLNLSNQRSASPLTLRAIGPERETRKVQSRINLRPFGLYAATSKTQKEDWFKFLLELPLQRLTHKRTPLESQSTQQEPAADQQIQLFHSYTHQQTLHQTSQKHV